MNITVPLVFVNNYKTEREKIRFTEIVDIFLEMLKERAGNGWDKNAGNQERSRWKNTYFPLGEEVTEPLSWVALMFMPRKFRKSSRF